MEVGAAGSAVFAIPKCPVLLNKYKKSSSSIIAPFSHTPDEKLNLLFTLGKYVQFAPSSTERNTLKTDCCLPIKNKCPAWFNSKSFVSIPEGIPKVSHVSPPSVDLNTKPKELNPNIVPLDKISIFLIWMLWLYKLISCQFKPWSSEYKIVYNCGRYHLPLGWVFIGKLTPVTFAPGVWGNLPSISFVG